MASNTDIEDRKASSHSQKNSPEQSLSPETSQTNQKRSSKTGSKVKQNRTSLGLPTPGSGGLRDSHHGTSSHHGTGSRHGSQNLAFPRRRSSNKTSSFQAIKATRSGTGFTWDEHGKKKAAQVLNTYRMTPEPNERFKEPVARKMITTTLKRYLDTHCSDKVICGNFSKSLADMIKDRAKELGFSRRYKYVSTVTVGQRMKHDVMLSSRCLMDTATDSFASVTHWKGNMFAVATLYAIYQE